MTQWYVKEIAKLTNVSTQTLHHYDRIDLLKPSVRLPNGYRLYSERDLLRLQQIIALKFFGFELSQIKTLLSGEVDIKDQFVIQSGLLGEKARILMEASKTLKEILSHCNDESSLPWETIIQLIEVYRMTENIENTWVKQALTAEELKQYVEFENGLKTRFSREEIDASKKEWTDIVNLVHASIQKDPASKEGIILGKRCLDWVINMYGTKYASLRKSIWEKGFKEGYAEEYHGLSFDGVEWLDKAMSAYCKDRICKTLNQIGTHPTQEVAVQWNDFLTEMYGEDQKLKDELVKAALLDENISKAAKDWLKKSV